ncbi:MAG: fasciclin domain-containing protein [Arcticibacter sp.]
MKKIMLSAAFAALIGLATTQAQTTDSTSNSNAATASTQKVAPSGDVTQAIASSGYNASLATAIKNAGLESTLKGAGPFTVFAPSDQAFASVPAGDSLLTQQPKLAATLKNHIVNGKYSKDDIIKALTAGKGVATLNTIDGSTVTLKVNENKNLELSDAAGNKALVTVFDVEGTNGTVHVINNVLVPKQ